MHLELALGLSDMHRSCSLLVRIPLLRTQSVDNSGFFRMQFRVIVRCHTASQTALPSGCCSTELQAGLAGSNMQKTIRQAHKASNNCILGQVRRCRSRILPARLLTATAATGAAEAAASTAVAAGKQVTQKQQQQQKPQYSTDAVTATAFEEEQYEHTKQAKSRHEWAASVR
jgi:hypothetical protein